jgi:hypothetical protein
LGQTELFDVSETLLGLDHEREAHRDPPGTPDAIARPTATGAGAIMTPEAQARHAGAAWRAPWTVDPPLGTCDSPSRRCRSSLDFRDPRDGEVGCLPAVPTKQPPQAGRPPLTGPPSFAAGIRRI